MTGYRPLALLCLNSLARFAHDLGQRQFKTPISLRNSLIAGLVTIILSGYVPIGEVAMAAPGDTGIAPGSTLAAGSFEADIDTYWRQIFATDGLDYWTPAVVAFSEGVNSGCGYVAPDQFIAFYCSVDVAVYWSVPVYDTVSQRSGGAAWVNIMAHEWSHHVQLLLGLNTPWRQNNDSVGLELEATCMGGAYVADARDRGLVDEDLIASMVRMFGGSDTHGTRDQVRAAFRSGVDNGIAACGVAL